MLDKLDDIFRPVAAAFYPRHLSKTTQHLPLPGRCHGEGGLPKDRGDATQKFNYNGRSPDLYTVGLQSTELHLLRSYQSSRSIRPVYQRSYCTIVGFFLLSLVHKASQDKNFEGQGQRSNFRATRI